MVALLLVIRVAKLKVTKYKNNYAFVCNNDGVKILQGEKAAVSLTCLQHFAGVAAGTILGEGNTNKLTELTASAIKNRADFFIVIKGCF